jgi:hypothetical protein
LFIPRFETLGAASVSLLTQSITALLQLIYVVFLFRLKADFSYIIRLCILTTIMIAVVYATQLFIKGLIAEIFISGAVVMISATALKILRPFRFFSILLRNNNRNSIHHTD